MVQLRRRHGDASSSDGLDSAIERATAAVARASALEVGVAKQRDRRSKLVLAQGQIFAAPGNTEVASMFVSAVRHCRTHSAMI